MDGQWGRLVIARAAAVGKGKGHPRDAGPIRQDGDPLIVRRMPAPALDERAHVDPDAGSRAVDHGGGEPRIAEPRSIAALPSNPRSNRIDGPIALAHKLRQFTDGSMR